MAQFIRPSSDLPLPSFIDPAFGADYWSTPAWDHINEVIPNDGNFTSFTHAITGASSFGVLHYMDATSVQSPKDTVITFRIRVSATRTVDQGQNIQLYLTDGADLGVDFAGAQWDAGIDFPVDGSFHTLTTITAWGGIPDWANLACHMSWGGTPLGGSSTDHVRVSWVEIEVSDALGVSQLPLELIYPFPYVSDLEAADDPWAPASTADGTAGSAVSGQTGAVGGPQSNVGGCLPFQDFIDALAAKLEDPTFVHWTAVELQRYIIEALRTWQAFTQTLRNRGVFLATTGGAFYDLPTVLPSLRGYNVTDLDLLIDIEYALMEPPAIGIWLGSGQFTIADIAAAIERRRDLFLRETGAVLTREVRNVTPPVNGRLTFPNDVVTIRRAAWISSTGVVTPLQRDDEWGMNKYRKDWPQQSVNPAQTWPTAYSVGVTPPLTLQVAPPITDAGQLDLVSVILGADLGSDAPGVLLGVPDDWAWVVKFGALSDLLSQQGVAFDPERAAYCEARWQHGITLATAATVVLAAQINNAVTAIVSVSDADKYKRTWQTTPAAPTLVLTDGQNIVALAPVPDDGTDTNGYTVTLDLVVNFPVPVGVTDCIDVDKSIMEQVIDYAQHLAMFKEGAGQVQASMKLYETFAREAGITVDLNTASVPNRGALFQQTVQDQRQVPRISPTESQEPSS